MLCFIFSFILLLLLQNVLQTTYKLNPNTNLNTHTQQESQRSALCQNAYTTRLTYCVIMWPPPLPPPPIANTDFSLVLSFFPKLNLLLFFIQKTIMIIFKIFKRENKKSPDFELPLSFDWLANREWRRVEKNGRFWIGRDGLVLAAATGRPNAESAAEWGALVAIEHDWLGLGDVRVWYGCHVALGYVFLK